MKSIDFPGAYMKIGEGQDQYHTIHAMPLDGEEGEVVCIYELTDEEVEAIVKNRKLFYSRLTFHNQTMCKHCMKITPTGFQPMLISATPLKMPVKLSYEDGQILEVMATLDVDGMTIEGYTKTPEGKFIKNDVQEGQRTL